MKLKTLAAVFALSSGALFAQTVDVKDAWARATVPGQKATGAFMKLTAKEGTKLVAISSPVAGVGEVHEMKMEGDVMKMRAVTGGLDLPAGKAVELKPGGYHVMLM
ncbi:MAG: copper chaperone PCu(A)C, partial [Burkholderiales bacterium]